MNPKRAELQKRLQELGRQPGTTAVDLVLAAASVDRDVARDILLSATRDLVTALNGVEIYRSVWLAWMLTSNELFASMPDEYEAHAAQRKAHADESATLASADRQAFDQRRAALVELALRAAVKEVDLMR